MPERLIHHPVAAPALGLKTGRAVRALCERYQIPVIHLSKRVKAMRESDYALLLERASEREAA